MHKYRKLIPIAAVLLVAFGVNLDRFGIDLDKLSGQTTPSTTSQKSTNSQTNIPDSSTSSSISASAATNKPQSRPHWSNTSPKVNLKHIFEGEINRKGKPVGYHARPGGIDPVNSRVVNIKSGPNQQGVYTASIEIKDGNEWKSKFSSFFPDKLNDDEVIAVVLHAFKNSNNPKKQPWSGPSGMGFNIQGYTASSGAINTAFPVFQK